MAALPAAAPPAPAPAPEPPRAPGGLPLVGHGVQLARRPLEFMDGLRRHGAVVRVGLGTSAAYVVTDPELTRTVLVTDAKSFVKGGRIIDALRLFFGDGLATIADGEQHRRNRRLMQPMFNRAHIAGRGEAMIAHVAQLVDAWTEGVARPVNQEMNDLTLSVFLVALFGTALPAGTREEFIRVLPRVMAGTIRQTILPGWFSALPLPAHRRYRADLARLRDLVDHTIEHGERGQAGAPAGDRTGDAAPGLFRALVDARDPETGQGLGRGQLRDEVVTLLTGSVETTGTTLSWALHEIGRDPEIERRLHEEIDAVCAGRRLRYADLPSLVYTRSVLQETMRLYGPAWLVTRRTTAAVNLGGYRIPAGADVVYSPYILQHDPAVFPDPARFDPDRWDPARAGAIPRASFLAFGAGGRQCIGESFAWSELLIILALIAGRWRLAPADAAPVRPVAQVTVHPDRLLMTARRRGGAAS
jgi:cytochrome P450